ncbi:unnamed protein product [Orchesella dallaii]|uniref:Uncharacterized protein n=1 Tax=Orchesella dallaii TaxID=48710 RepID=A0ABP1QJI4_9HEXA
MLLHVLFPFVCSVLLSSKPASSVIISPCKVRNLMTQPVYGTNLKTKSLVNIIQLPPVFTQNVMVGICENRNQNISTGRGGEFYVCQQRYSAVEVYTAEGTSSSGDAYRPTPAEKLSNIKYTRESVIIESGCDFTFNLFPYMSDFQNPSEQQQGTTAQTIKQQMFLRSPYHPTANVPGVQNGIRPSTSSTYVQGKPDVASAAPASVNSEGYKTQARAHNTLEVHGSKSETHIEDDGDNTNNELLE